MKWRRMNVIDAFLWLRDSVSTSEEESSMKYGKPSKGMKGSKAGSSGFVNTPSLMVQKKGLKK